MNRPLGYAMCWVAVMGAITLGAGESGADRLASGLAGLPAWAYIGFRGWPVLASEDIPDSWTRFDGTAAEFVFRMLTERAHPHSVARYYDTHWFQSYEDVE
ncbi:hypothetical protein ACFC18_41965 [Streptomyces sp. NPDC056121]|uniref:hypothetical protein n=1 Tax=Streptomyces TaxID=1883 RepID=UPI001D0A1FA2|nr:hypothetical protein [Streptomyces longhuiensis]UDM01703.1 hypothetical protein LGI35_27265 [Streptomyces longhuiensis]